MKTKWLKKGFAVSLLLGILSMVSFACAEENGYWTMKADESGTPVMIYTYTKQVDWVVDEDAGYGHCDMGSTQPISSVEQADVHLANSPAPAQIEKTKPKQNSFFSSALFLAAGLSAILMTAFIYIIKFVKSGKKIYVIDHPDKR